MAVRPVQGAVRHVPPRRGLLRRFVLHRRIDQHLAHHDLRWAGDEVCDVGRNALAGAVIRHRRGGSAPDDADRDRRADCRPGLRLRAGVRRRHAASATRGDGTMGTTTLDDETTLSPPAAPAAGGTIVGSGTREDDEDEEDEEDDEDEIEKDKQGGDEHDDDENDNEEDEEDEEDEGGAD
jgi:hypothetical protein